MIELKDAVLENVCGGGGRITLNITKTNVSNLSMFNFGLGKNAELEVQVTQAIS